MSVKPPVFPDSRFQLCSFVEAHYELELAATSSHVSVGVVARIELCAYSKGRPLFELGVDPDRLQANPTLLDARLDGAAIACETVQFHGDGDIPLVAASRSVDKGMHVLTLRYDLCDVVRPADAVRMTTNAGVDVRFVMSDLSERGSQYLGRYLPSNLDFDAYPMTFDVVATGVPGDYTLMTNAGPQPRLGGENRWRFETPEHFKPSFVWFHLFLSSSHVIDHKSITIDGNELSITVYGSIEEFSRGPNRISLMLAAGMRRAISRVRYLVGRYGPFPTPELTILLRERELIAATSPGCPEIAEDPLNMEFAGALSAELRSVSHEIFHCYFGRCVSPANGDAAWFDEAVAAWEDSGSPRRDTAPVYPRGFLGRSALDRRTHANRDAADCRFLVYTAGGELIAYLNHLLVPYGGMTAFLETLLAQRRWQSYTNGQLLEMLESIDPSGKAPSTFRSMVEGDVGRTL